MNLLADPGGLLVEDTRLPGVLFDFEKSIDPLAELRNADGELPDSEICILTLFFAHVF